MSWRYSKKKNMNANSCLVFEHFRIESRTLYLLHGLRAIGRQLQIFEKKNYPILLIFHECLRRNMHKSNSLKKKNETKIYMKSYLIRVRVIHCVVRCVCWLRSICQT